MIQTRTIVYLDDDQLDQKLMELIFKRETTIADVELIAALTIEEAAIALRENCVTALVLDNRMPESMNFHETLQKLGTIDPSVKIIVTSSEIDSEEFLSFDGLDRAPDAVVEKIGLRKAFSEGLLDDDRPAMVEKSVA